jgi:uncharacterized alkaline shock family protein YloU
MSEVINSIFGRAQNETPGSGDYGYGAAAPAPVATEPAAETEETDSSLEVAPAAETAEDESTEDTETTETAETDEDTEDTAEDATAEDEDQAEDDEAAEETVEDEAGAEVVDEEPVVLAVVTEDADSAEAADSVEAIEEADAADAVEEAEPVAADARPAAGTRGSTTVADGVVTKIVTMVARKTEGVHELDEAGISVDVEGEVATIAVTLVVEFGRAVKVLAEQLRIKLIEAVEQYLGLEVAVVDVHVADIHFPEGV